MKVLFDVLKYPNGWESLITAYYILTQAIELKILHQWQLATTLLALLAARVDLGSFFLHNKLEMFYH